MKKFKNIDDLPISLFQTEYRILSMNNWDRMDADRALGFIPFTIGLSYNNEYNETIVAQFDCDISSYIIFERYIHV